MSKLNLDCIESWHKYCPDYEFVRISENNFDVCCNEYVSTMYENGSYAFVSDVARVWALEKLGGFYLDTDCELHSSLDNCIDMPAIASEYGRGVYGTAFLGQPKGRSIYSDALEMVTFDKPLHIALNELLYERYNITGSQLQIEEDVALFGIKYTGTSKTKPGLILTHHDENTWIDGWTGGFKPRSDMIALSIFVNGRRRKQLENKWFGNKLAEARLEVKTEPTLQEIELANFLRNPRVWKIKFKEGCIQRYGKLPKLSLVNHDGIEVYVEE